MIYLIPNKTLSHYLTKNGYSKFKEWYKSILFLEPIYNELEILSNNIDKTHWLEDDIRSNLFEKIKNIIIKHYENSFDQHPEIIYKIWIESLQPYCFQGGKGYKLQYTGNINHHWCISPEYYDYVLNIPNNVILSCIFCDKYVNISEKIETEVWGN
jgi:hypothetical protein